MNCVVCQESQKVKKCFCGYNFCHQCKINEGHVGQTKCHRCQKLVCNSFMGNHGENSNICWDCGTQKKLENILSNIH